MKSFLLSCFLLFIVWVPVQAQSVPWDEQDAYVNGFARVFHNNLFSFADTQQQLIGPFIYQDARPFYHHLAAAKYNDKWGFINEAGKVVIPFSYEIVFNFYDEVTVLYKPGSWWLADNRGKLIRQLDISSCEGFRDGKAVVYNKAGQKGIMDMTGSMRFEEKVSSSYTQHIPYPNSNVLSVCPDNLDFEFGNFTNWQCYIGRVDSVGTTNVITVNPSPPTANRHTIYARAPVSPLDAFGLFPTNPPDGSQFAVRLGNTNVGAQAERIRYTIRVPQNDSNFSFRYHYAAVLQDPGHTSWTQPRFTAKLLDSATNTYITCASFEFISTSNLPGFSHSTVDPNVIYKPWSGVFISLRGYAGKTLYLEFTTADCVRTAHWGYAYVDVEDMCGQTAQVVYNCTLPHITTLTGPPGFQFYNWWNQNFTQLLGTGQTVTLNPGPPPNSTVWLEVVPFVNFGCLDTIPILISGTTSVHFDASDTMGVCAPHSFTFYNRNIPSATATWDFGDGTTGTGDTVTHTFALPGTYIVKLNVLEAGGCSGIYTDTVRVIQPTASYNYTGGSFCNSHTVQFTATTSNIDSLFWDFGDGTILHTTLTTVSHTYAQPGIYIPHVIAHANGGCDILLPGVDTVRIEQLVPGYLSAVSPGCLITPVVFTDTSHAFFGIATRIWDFGDGTFGAGNPVSHTYTTTGNYTIKLIITGVFGCRDSVTRTIFVKINNKPASTITGDNLRCNNSTVTFTGTVVSADPVATMEWFCNNGTTGTGNTFTTTFGFPGTWVVSLVSTTVFGCKDTTSRSIVIQPLPTADIQSDATVCLNGVPPPITFIGGGSTAPYTFTYTINGGAPQTITTAAGNTITIAAPTTTAGTFVYQLVSVHDATALACSAPANGTATITVKPLPTANITGNAAACLNGTLPSVTFTGSGGTAPYTFTYNINNGVTQTITTVTGNSINLPVPTNIAGTFVYNLVGVQESSPQACSRVLGTSVTIVINPLPTAAISGNATVCRNAPSPLVTFTGAGTVAPYTFTYTINGGLPQTITTTVGNSITLPAPTNTPGTLVYTLISVQDGSPTACSQLQNGTVTININPLPAAVLQSDATVCLNGVPPPVTFVGSNSTAPYTFTYTINGGPPQTITTAAGNTVTIAAPTTVAGTFVYQLVSVQDGSPTACSQLQNGAITITVKPLPDATIAGNAAVCLNGTPPTVTFTGSGGTAPYTFTYMINNGPNQTITTTAGNSVTLSAPTNTAGTYTYTLVRVEESSPQGCSRVLGQSITIQINPLPAATVSGNATVCLNAPSPLVTFTGSGGTAPYTFTYNINGGPNQTVTTVAGNSITIPVSTATVGSFTYNLVSVQDASSTACMQLQSGAVTVVINPLPTASIGGNAIVCLNAPSPLVTFTGCGSTAPYTFTYNINGGPSQTITTTAGNFVTISAPTNTVGIFVYNLLSVQDGSSTACSQLQSGTATIVINPLPTAQVSGNTAVCLNAPSPLVTFTGGGSTAPYTFTYNINGGASQTITTIAGNSITIPVSTAVAGTFVYNLLSVQDGSSTACSQLQSGTATIIINPLPTATISGNAAVCLNGTAPLVTFTGAGSTAPYIFTYNINGGPNLTVSTTSGNSVSIPVPTSAVGTLTYNLLSVQDGSSTTCSQLQNGSVSITINPLPTAIISGTGGVCINGPLVPVTFTGANGTAPYTFTYSINGGPAQTVTTSTGNSVTIMAPTNVAGIFTYTLISVQDGSSTTCNQAQTGNVQITIDPPPPLNAGIDRTICQGRSVQLTATGAATYNWTPAGSLSCTACPDPVANPVDTTQYIVTGTSAFGCVGSDTVKVFVIKPFPMFHSPDDTLCVGKSTQLNASGASSYLWSPAAGLNRTDIANPVATPASTTTYRVIGYDGHSRVSDTAYIKVTVGPYPSVDAGPDLRLSTGDIITLNASVQNGPIIQWLWEPATDLSCNTCPSPRLTVHNDITYKVTVTNVYGCPAVDYVHISTFCKSAQVFIPNAFTPDGDGYNDVLMVRGKGIHVNYFRIFNRWGELIFERKNFEPNDPQFGWDGKIRGVLASPDVFVYTAEVICDNNVLYPLKGNVSLLK